jgi:hypothetical protein
VTLMLRDYDLKAGMAPNWSESASQTDQLPVEAAAALVMNADHENRGLRRLNDLCADARILPLPHAASSGTRGSQSRRLVSASFRSMQRPALAAARPAAPRHVAAIHAETTRKSPPGFPGGLFRWWARLGLNQRPLRCEHSALPLSYAPDTCETGRSGGPERPGVARGAMPLKGRRGLVQPRARPCHQIS